MRWIGRFFLVIALAFLALDVLDSGGTAVPPAAETTGETTGETAGGAETGGTATDGTATDGDATTSGTGDGATTDGTTADGASADGATAPPATTAPNRVVLRSLGERWFEYHRSSYLQVSPAVSRHVSQWLDDVIVQPLMLQPAFLIFFVLWLFFSLLSWLIGRARNDDW